VPRKFFRKFLPSHESVRQNRWIKPFGSWLHHPNLWHLNRRSVAGGVAIGLFCGLIPGPLQMLGATVLAVLWRVNLPVALATTLYTNPLTIVPLYVAAYELGALATGQHNSMTAAHFALPEFHWNDWWNVLMGWLSSLGHPFVVGLPLLALSLAVTGYAAVRLLWRGWVVWQWRKRKEKQ
jgi:uncharacterized protein (DUF2062 family)